MNYCRYIDISIIATAFVIIPLIFINDTAETQTTQVDNKTLVFLPMLLAPNALDKGFFMD